MCHEGLGLWGVGGAVRSFLGGDGLCVAEVNSGCGCTCAGGVSFFWAVEVVVEESVTRGSRVTSLQDRLAN